MTREFFAADRPNARPDTRVLFYRLLPLALAFPTAAPLAFGAETPQETAAIVPSEPDREETAEGPSPDIPVDRAGASSAIERATRAEREAAVEEEKAKLGGDAGVARRWAALVQAWGRVVSALSQAEKLEREAKELQQRQLQLEKQAGRAVTLVEQTEARRARALARLQELGLEQEDAQIIGTAESQAEESDAGSGSVKGKTPPREAAPSTVTPAKGKP